MWLFNKQKNKDDDQIFSEWLDKLLLTEKNNENLVYNFTYHFEKKNWVVELIVTDKVFKNITECKEEAIFISEKACVIFTNVDFGKIYKIIQALIFNYLESENCNNKIKNSKAICLGYSDLNVIYKNGKSKQELDFNKIKLKNIEEVFDIIKNNNAIYNKDE